MKKNRTDLTIGLRFPKKQRKTKKLTPTKVQIEFNAAIRRRDCNCVMSHSEHSGQLQASHFFTVGGNGALRFYPPNVHAQCAKHHHNEFHHDNPMPYARWMQEHVQEFSWMEDNRKREIKYNQQVLSEILAYCMSDNLIELGFYIERHLKINLDK
jgi:hypothetical protein